MLNLVLSLSHSLILVTGSSTWFPHGKKLSEDLKKELLLNIKMAEAIRRSPILVSVISNLWKIDV